ncbi:MAG: hypothetical protein ABIA63_07215 [bacterium]
MNFIKICHIYAIFIITFLCSNAMPLPAFSGAEGYGAEDNPGGRGYPVFKVTRLDDTDYPRQVWNLAHFTPGQFSWAVIKTWEAGGGTIVFDVSGTINLYKEIIIKDNTTIAGQTSPGGIAFAGATFHVKGSNIIIRHIRTRGTPTGGDGIECYGVKNVVFDHVSVSWYCDGAIDIIRNSWNVTAQWCHLGDAATCHGDNEPHHALPILIGYLSGNVTLHHNLITHAAGRCPKVTNQQPNCQVEFSNNVVYNYLKQVSNFDSPNGSANLISNYYIPGANSHADEPYKYSNGVPTSEQWPNGGLRTPIHLESNTSAFCYNNRAVPGWGHLLYDNEYSIATGDSGWVEGTRPDDTYDEWSCAGGMGFDFGPHPGRRIRLDKRVDMPAVTYHQVDSNYNYVLGRFGAFPRDNTDKRLEQETINRTGRWRDQPSPDNNTYEQHNVPQDSDNDGMPDSWEDSHGLNKNDSLDYSGTDLSTEGYTNIEVYINELADNITHAMPESPALLDLNMYKTGGRLPDGVNPAPFVTSALPALKNVQNSKNILKISGNPLRDITMINCILVGKEFIGKHISIEVYDISGKTAGIWPQKTGPGLVSWKWDGLDIRNKKLSNGYYLVTLKADSKIISKESIVLLK